MVCHISDDKLGFLNSEDILAELSVPYKDLIVNFDQECTVQSQDTQYYSEKEETNKFLQGPDHIL